jgi:5-formyltetrahydrofolate cyclo-ligase
VQLAQSASSQIADLPSQSNNRAFNTAAGKGASQTLPFFLVYMKLSAASPARQPLVLALTLCQRHTPLPAGAGLVNSLAMKPALRKQVKQAMAAMSSDERAARSRDACDRLLAQPEFAEASTVMLYLSMLQELDTAAVALAAWQQSKTVVVPKLCDGHRHMIAVRIDSLESGLASGRYGIREPHCSDPWPLEEIDLVVVPALAFDRRGHRLGRGGGYYDRFLAEPSVKAVACGLAFSQQVYEELPIETHDRPVDLLVSDREVLRFKRTESAASGHAAGEEGAAT